MVPAIIQAGDTYNDLGATITGPQADLNLGIQTYFNGSPMGPIKIDTSGAATDTIDYVATDQNGFTKNALNPTAAYLIERALDEARSRAVSSIGTDEPQQFN